MPDIAGMPDIVHAATIPSRQRCKQRQWLLHRCQAVSQCGVTAAAAWEAASSTQSCLLPQYAAGSGPAFPIPCHAMLSPAALPDAGVVWISSLHAATQAAVSANLRELGLRSAVAQQDLREHQVAQQQQQQAAAFELDYRQPPVPRPQNRKLDIVMAYTSGQSTQETVRVWRQVGVTTHSSDERSQQVVSRCTSCRL